MLKHWKRFDNFMQRRFEANRPKSDIIIACVGLLLGAIVIVTVVLLLR